MSPLLLIILIILLFGGFATYPRWQYSANWGYGPFGVIGVILIILLVLVLAGHVRL